MTPCEGAMRSDPDRLGYRTAALLLLLTLVLAGCAHEKAYKRSARLSEDKQYARAIEELEQAIALAEKGNKDKAAERYREKLVFVKIEASRYYYAQAETCFTRGDLGKAHTHIERCVTYCPEDQSYRAFRQRVQAAVAEAETMRTEALSLADEKQWKAAVDRMNEALGVYSTMPGGQGDLKHIKDRAYQYFLAQAEEKLRDNDLTGAEAQAQTALAYRDTGPEATSVLNTVKGRREATTLISRGRILLEGGNYDEALRVLERALDLHPSQADLPGLLASARQGVCEAWIVQGRAAMDAGQHAQALVLFGKSRDLLPGYGDTATLIAENQTQLIRTHMEASRQHLDDGLPGCAIVHAATVLGYDRLHTDARRQLNQSAAQVREAVHYAVALAGIRAPLQHRPVAARIEAMIQEYLSGTQPDNVAVVDRPDLRAVFLSPEIDPSKAINTQSLIPIATEYGLNALVVGRIVECAMIRETQITGHGESIYQDGYRPEPNPDYLHAEEGLRAAIRALDQARRRLGEAEARLARYDHIDPADPVARAKQQEARAAVAEARQRLVNAASDVGAAELNLAATPKEQVVPNMVAYTYPIEEVTWTGKLNCLVKILDVATGTLLMTERVEGRHAESDRMVVADPIHNVPEDRLELPEERHLFDSAAQSLMAKLKPALGDALARHGQRFVDAMRHAQATGNESQAVDSAVMYLFAYPNSTDQTGRMVECLRDYLGQEDALIDIRRLLRTHCQILK